MLVHKVGKKRTFFFFYLFGTAFSSAFTADLCIINYAFKTWINHFCTVQGFVAQSGTCSPRRSSSARCCVYRKSCVIFCQLFCCVSCFPSKTSQSVSRLTNKVLSGIHLALSISQWKSNILHSKREVCSCYFLITVGTVAVLGVMHYK